jgi:hypothetical protein
VKEARETVAATIGERRAANGWWRTVESFGIDSQGNDARLVAVHKTGVSFGDGAPAEAVKLPADQKVFVSDTGEVAWNLEIPGAAYLAVNTPNTKLFTGSRKGEPSRSGT